MKRHHSRSAPTNPFLSWSKLAWKNSEMLMASAQVINHRCYRMAMAGAQPNARDRREFTLMGQEKIEAATESIQALSSRAIVMNAQLGALAFRQALSGMSGLLSAFATPAVALSARGQAELLRDAVRNSGKLASHFSDSMARLAHHGIRPIHSRATGNARRLLKLR